MNKYEQQAAEFLQKTNTKLTVEFSHHGKHFADDKQTRDVYKCKLSRGNRSYEFNFGQSINNSGYAHNKYTRVIPTAYDILACLTKYDPGTFEDFCSEFGYDTDSRNAERTYKAVVKEWEAVNRLFTDEEIEELAEIN